MRTITINFIVPQGWHELSNKQLYQVYQLIADNFATDESRVWRRFYAENLGRDLANTVSNALTRNISRRFVT